MLTSGVDIPLVNLLRNTLNLCYYPRARK